MIRYIILTVSLHRSRNQGVSEIRNYSYTKNKQPLFIFRFSFYIYKRKKLGTAKCLWSLPPWLIAFWLNENSFKSPFLPSQHESLSNDQTQLFDSKAIFSKAFISFWSFMFQSTPLPVHGALFPRSGGGLCVWWWEISSPNSESSHSFNSIQTSPLSETTRTWLIRVPGTFSLTTTGGSI